MATTAPDRPTWTPQPGKALVLRTVGADGISQRGFRWPETGPVEAPDWEPTPSCGHGLHGLLWGDGPASLLDWPESARWQVVEVDVADVVDLGGKVKFPRGVVVYTGDGAVAGALVSAHAPIGTKCIRGTATAGEGGTATAGEGGIATAGENGLIAITHYDTDADQYRRLHGIVGQEGIEPNVAYRIKDGRFVRAGQPATVSA